MTATLRYRLAHQDSLLGVAYFTPAPCPDMSLEACLDHVRHLPRDEFMRAHVRPLLAALGQDDLLNLARDRHPAIRSLVLETVLLTPALAGLWPGLEAQVAGLAEASPQPFLASLLLPDHNAHAQASQALAANIFEHAPLSADLEALGLTVAPDVPRTDPSGIAADLPGLPPCPRRPTVQTRLLAMERLFGLGILDGPEMRHHASLAPWGLLRRWRLDRTVRCGEFDYRLDGLMTSYGRGLVLEDAQASLAMEIVERYSSFADIREGRVSGSQEGGEILSARWSEVRGQALDPNRMCLEVPYQDQPLHWIEARDVQARTVLVPLQAIYLFTNLDEIRLFTALGSTGLASGNTPEEAKVSGLLEVIERDSEAADVFDPGRCFRVTSSDPALRELLARYQEQGIDPVFQDLTTELGVPCYKCFVHLTKGGLVKATGASLSGPRALVSALTETPFPFPDGPASVAGPGNLPVRAIEDLPDHATGSAAGDLALLEAILEERRHVPLYVNLTKRELRLPVYRAIVPGLEIVSDFDRFTRVSPRLWRQALKVTGTNEGRRPVNQG